MFIVILQIYNFVLVFVSLMVRFGYFKCFDITILRDCCCAKTVLTSWIIVFSFDTLDQNIILWGYDKTDAGWMYPWECEIGCI